MKKRCPKYLHATILLINIAFMALAINTSIRLFYVAGVIIAIATIVYFLYIKLVAKRSLMFEKLKLQHGLIILIIAAIFLIMGILKANSIKKTMTMQYIEQESSN